MFVDENERRDLENWDKLTLSLLEDLAKIYLLDIPADGDSLNVAIVKNEDNEYIIRYFGFDFSEAGYIIPKKSIPFCSVKTRYFNSRINRMLNLILDTVVRSEYGFDNYEYKNIGRDLKDSLLSRYKEALYNKIIEIQPEIDRLLQQL